MYEHLEVHACSRWSVAQAIGPKLGVSPYSILDWMKKDAALAQMGESSAVDYAAENAHLRPPTKERL